MVKRAAPKIKKIKKVKKFKGIQKKVKATKSYTASVRGRDMVAGRDIKQTIYALGDEGKAQLIGRSGKTAANLAQQAFKTQSSIAFQDSSWDRPPAYSSAYSEWNGPIRTPSVNLNLTGSERPYPQESSAGDALSQRTNPNQPSSIRRVRPILRHPKGSEFLAASASASSPGHGQLLRDDGSASGSSLLSEDDEGQLQLKRPIRMVVRKAEEMGAKAASVLSDAGEAVGSLFSGHSGSAAPSVSSVAPSSVSFAPSVEKEVLVDNWGAEMDYKKPGTKTINSWLAAGAKPSTAIPGGKRSSTYRKWNYRLSRWERKKQG